MYLFQNKLLQIRTIEKKQYVKYTLNGTKHEFNYMPKDYSLEYLDIILIPGG
jgi:hypothetical protein